MPRARMFKSKLWSWTELASVQCGHKIAHDSTDLRINVNIGLDPNEPFEVQ